MSFMRIKNVVMRSLFNKPATQMYPVVQKEYHEDTRGHVDIDIDKCIFCGICAKKCPSNAISVDRKTRGWTIERMRCIQCRSCVEQCPKKCLGMGISYTQPGTEKVTDRFTGPEPPAKPEKTEAANHA